MILENGKKYWMTLCAVSDVDVALFGDRDEKYYRVVNGNWVPSKDMTIVEKIIVEKSSHGKVEEILSGVEIPYVIMEVSYNTDELILESDEKSHPYKKCVSLLGNTKSFVMAVAVQRNIKKDEDMEETYLLKEATEEELKEYSSEHDDKIFLPFSYFADKTYCYSIWESRLYTMIREAKQEKREMLKQRKQDLLLKKVPFMGRMLKQKKS